MSNYVRKMKMWLGLMFCAAAFGQQTTRSTTLTTAVPLSGTTQWCVASATGIVLPNLSTGQQGSYLLVDREVAQIQAQGVSSTCYKVVRGQIGSSASASHSVGSTVWIGQPATSSNDPSRPFTGAFVTTVPTGSCVATDQFTLPVLYVGSVSNGALPGTAYNCVQSQWRVIGLLVNTGFSGSNEIVTSDAFGGGGVFRASRANGTPQAPTALLTGQAYAAFSGIGYMATGYSANSRASIIYTTTEGWSDTANGSKITLETTPNGTATRVNYWTLDQNGAFVPSTNGVGDFGSSTNQVPHAYMLNCTSGASPAVCGASVVGGVAVAAAATSLVVNTTAVTAKSRIVLTMDSSLGSDLGVTCNTTNIAAWVSARTAGTSFTITTASGPVTNPMCLNFILTN